MSANLKNSSSFPTPWRTGKPGMLQFMGLKRVRHDLATEQQQTLYKLELLDQRVYIYVALVCECMLSRFTCVWFCATQWIVDCQAPLSVGFSRQEYWSGLPCPSPGDLSNSGIKPRCPALWTNSLPTKPLGKPQWVNSNAFINMKCIFPNLWVGLLSHPSESLLALQMAPSL